jgi:LacI family transcriptional regulator
MRIQRIGIAINPQYMRAEDQELYQGFRAYSREHPEFRCMLAPFAAEDLKAAGSSRPPYDGILAQATPQLVEITSAMGVPVVDVWRDSPVLVPIHCVFPDFAKAGRMVAQHLISRGFESFGYVVNSGVQSQAEMCDANLIAASSRSYGPDIIDFAGELAAGGFKCSRFVAPKVVVANAQVWRRWVTSIRQWLHKQVKPIGLFVPNVWMCRHIAHACAEMGFKVPYDVGLVCADNEPNLCLLASPSLTSIDLGYRRVGYEAAAMLQRLLQERKRDGKQDREILFVEPNVLHPRGSTDAANVRDPMVAAAMRYILEHAHEGIGVLDVAKHVATTRRTLERRFRAVLDRTVMKEISRCRLERLKRQLTQSDLPIKCLVENSGYVSVRMLREAFVREEGISPSAYRAKRWVAGKPK